MSSDRFTKARLSRRGLFQTGAAGLALAGLAGLPKGAFAQATPSAPPASPAVDPYSGEKVTITYGYWDSAQQPGVQQLLAAFNEQFPDITVEEQLVPWADYWTKLQTSVAGGEAFDIFWINSASLPVYASAGSLLPIDSLVDSGSLDTSLIAQPLVDMYGYDGTQYGVPYQYDTIGVFFNKDIFDDAGMEYPDDTWDWDTFRNAAEQLTDAGKGQWGVGIQTSFQEGFSNFIFQNEGRLLNDDATECVVDEPAACEALEYLTAFFTDELTPGIAIQQANPVADSLFPAGQVAMLPGGSFRASTYAQADANIDVAPLPKGKTRATVIHGVAHVGWSRTEAPGAVLELINFLAGEEAQKIVGESGMGLPAREGLEQAWLDALPDMNARVFSDAAEYAVQVPSPTTGPEWLNALTEVVTKGFEGEIPADQICVEAAEAANKALSGEG